MTKQALLKNASLLRAILMTLAIRWCDAEGIARYGRSSRVALNMPLHAAIRQVSAQYCPSIHHDHQLWREKSTCGVVKLLTKAIIQKAQNEPSNELIEATSCIERSNATFGAEELSNFSSYQMLTTCKK
jgi:hypothetical protein